MFVWTSLSATVNRLCKPGKQSTVAPDPGLGPWSRFQLGDLKRDAIKNSMDEYMTRLIHCCVKAGLSV